MKIERLKNKILQLAIQGKLISQNPNDESASQLAKKINEERNKLIAEKKIKKEKPLSEITENEKPFDLPNGWEWLRFGDIAVYKKGPFGSSITKSMFVQKSEDSIKVYEQKNAIQKQSEIGDYYITKEKYEELKSFEVFPGDIIVSCAGTIGETYIMPESMEKGIINQALMRITLSEHVNSEFYLMYFKYILSSQITSESKGSAIKNIPPLAHLKNIVFPLPPIEEQERIVKKVNQLFSKVNDLEMNKTDLLKIIMDTKNKVLQLAIQGKIVEQNEEDEPASILLGKIGEQKNQLISEKKIKKEKPLDKISEKEKPFDLPNSWEWVRLNDICSLVTDGTHHTPTYTEEGVPFISVKDITKGIIDFSDTKFISKEEHEQLVKRCNPEYGDVLLTKVGTTGIAKVVDTHREFSLFVSVALLKIFKEYIDPYYLEYLINSPFVKKQSEENTQGIGNKNLVIRCIKNFILPIPPLEEQKRIVEKLNVLMSYFNELEDVAK